MNKVPVSVAIITKNEEKDLPGCLKSVSFAAEVVIVDCGSTDRTGDVAVEFGARWFVEPWKGYGPQKNSALEKCLHDWVLILDADERVPEKTALKIADLLSGKDLADGYSFRWKNFFHGKWIKSTDWWPDEHVRLVRKSKCKLDGLTHEKLAVNGSTAKLSCCIEHFSYTSYSELFRKLDDYSTELAAQMHSDGKRAGPAAALLRGSWMFFRNYVLKLGFTAGFDGFVISLSKGAGTFLKYAKLYELRKFSSDKPPLESRDVRSGG
ncbi:MAG: glycosyltransferase family 2 protein [Syntrophobacteraceae bacterium]|jgi:glycosyltransferase involved in cell wall biosynthesis